MDKKGAKAERGYPGPTRGDNSIQPHAIKFLLNLGTTHNARGCSHSNRTSGQIILMSRHITRQAENISWGKLTRHRPIWSSAVICSSHPDVVNNFLAAYTTAVTRSD